MNIQGAASVGRDFETAVRAGPKGVNTRTFDQLLLAAKVGGTAAPAVARADAELFSVQERLSPAFRAVWAQ